MTTTRYDFDDPQLKIRNIVRPLEQRNGSWKEGVSGLPPMTAERQYILLWEILLMRRDSEKASARRKKRGVA